MTFADFTRRCLESKTVSTIAARRIALNLAMNDLEIITTKDWKTALDEWLKTPDDTLDLIMPIKDTPTLVLTEAYHIVPINATTRISQWLQSIFVKLCDAHWAWLYWVHGEQDPSFRQTALETIWAASTEGQAALKGKDIRDVAVKASVQKELDAGLKKVRKEVLAKTRVLHAFARFGPIVALDTRWESRSFNNSELAAIFQQSVLNLFDHFNKECPLTDKDWAEDCMIRLVNAEWSLVNLVKTSTVVSSHRCQHCGKAATNGRRPSQTRSKAERNWVFNWEG
ncbi:hypothetical protein BT96DRAFT_471820 [Gymnopus androsaceus JB14]|uniref:Uncharacterized protein n=1 Tax=Gymnopus androsaceus JB14 TaxID=1447944 RepID=A0A6A4IHW6_9AGAR|nr:hypothetical protein BT96DRAFT_471820 [Gymnopus androsaceus JB14]